MVASATEAVFGASEGSKVNMIEGGGATRCCLATGIQGISYAQGQDILVLTLLTIFQDPHTLPTSPQDHLCPQINLLPIPISEILCAIPLTPVIIIPLHCVRLCLYTPAPGEWRLSERQVRLPDSIEMRRQRRQVTVLPRQLIGMELRLRRLTIRYASCKNSCSELPPSSPCRLLDRLVARLELLEEGLPASFDGPATSERNEEV